MKKLIPFFIFIALIVLFYIGLSLNPKEVPSPFIDKPAPFFSTPKLYHKQEKVSNEDLKGQVWLLNVFASWCVSCRAEHKIITNFTEKFKTVVVGLNYKDAEEDAKSWLQQFGNPYNVIAVDIKGDIGIEYGVYGVPETFVIDKKGFVRLKHIGPVDEKSLQDKIVPLVLKLEGE
jgi:cytochrome c biogenesis protein CcmG, thiol:disulfide interchange protein DsbE